MPPKLISFADQELFPYNALDIFNIILDVDKYPEFIPWCRQLKIISRNELKIIADSTIEFKSITASYQSEITFQPPSIDKVGYINVLSTQGAFKYLKNIWEFYYKDHKQTLVKFSINCQFRSKMMHYAMSMVYHKAQQKVIKAFKDRIYLLLR